MRIGGTAKYFAELKTREDIEEAVRFAAEHSIPLIPLGSGSNTIFADGEIAALVVRLQHADVVVDRGQVRVGAGKNLAILINELAVLGFDLSALTGIPGTVGGAIFGNAGQGPKGTWIDAFVELVTAFARGEWQTMKREECGFGYRESGWKSGKCLPAGKAGKVESGRLLASILWEVVFVIPKGEPEAIKKNIESLLQKRIETQPHLKTAGSCFKAVGDTPAWKLIDAAGLRGLKIGGVEISLKHANFLMNVGDASYDDAVKIVEEVKQKIPKNLDVEMRFFDQNGTVRF